MEAWGGLAALFAAGLVVKSRKRWGRQALTSHGSARWATGRDVRQAGLSRAHGVVLGVLDGQVWMDDKETHDLLLAPTGSGKDTFHLFPTLQWGWTQSTLNLDCQNGEMYDKTSAVRAQYGRVEAFAPYRSPLARINVLDAIRLGKPEEFRDALLIGQSLTAPEKMRQESSSGAHFRELAALTITAALSACLLHSVPCLPGCGLALPHAAGHLYRCPQDYEADSPYQPWRTSGHCRAEWHAQQHRQWG